VERVGDRDAGGTGYHSRGRDGGDVLSEANGKGDCLETGGSTRRTHWAGMPDTGKGGQSTRKEKGGTQIEKQAPHRLGKEKEEATLPTSGCAPAGVADEGPRKRVPDWIRNH